MPGFEMVKAPSERVASYFVAFIAGRTRPQIAHWDNPPTEAESLTEAKEIQRNRKYTNRDAGSQQGNSAFFVGIRLGNAC